MTSDDLTTDAASDEAAFVSCEACNSPFMSKRLLLTREDGSSEGVLCADCASKLLQLLPHIDDQFIVVSPELFAHYPDQVINSIKNVITRRLYQLSSAEGRVRITFVEEGGQRGEVLVRIGGSGLVYRWSDMRDELSVL